MFCGQRVLWSKSIMVAELAQAQTHATSGKT
jgi:hypothetical protein